MSFIKSKFLRTVTSMLLIVAMAVGMVTGMEKKADAATITITYNLSGGQVSPYDSTKVVKKTYTAGYVTLERSGYYYPGKSLIGWATQSGGSKKYDPGQSVKITSSITLYAVWASGVSCTHSYHSASIIVQATCTRNGVEHCTCKNCGKTWDRTIYATGHQYGSTKTVSATCTKAGEKYRTCNLCGLKNVLETYPAKGHKYGSEITISATCETNGRKYKKCSVCKTEVTTKNLPATGHSGKVIKYNDSSTHTILCDRCNKQINTPHTYGTVTAYGAHTTGCTAEACYGKVLPNKPAVGSDAPCEKCVTNWDYYVDKTTFASDGKNLYLRAGTCPRCGTGVIEYGYAGFQDTSGKGKAFSSAVETLIAIAKFYISIKSVSISTGVKVAIKIHTAVGVLRKIKSTTETITEVHSDNSAYETQLQSSLNSIANLKYMDPADNAFSEELISAKNYFNNPSNIRRKFQFAYSD